MKIKYKKHHRCISVALLKLSLFSARFFLSPSLLLTPGLLARLPIQWPVLQILERPHQFRTGGRVHRGKLCGIGSRRGRGQRTQLRQLGRVADPGDLSATCFIRSLRSHWPALAYGISVSRDDILFTAEERALCKCYYGTRVIDNGNSRSSFLSDSCLPSGLFMISSGAPGT